MSIWFKGKSQLNSSIAAISNDLQNIGQHFEAIVSAMPGMKSVELIESGKDFVVIRTSEGLMKRTNISVRQKPDYIALEFDEEYAAQKLLTAKSHFVSEFTQAGNGVAHELTISNVQASGFLGFLYRNFGSRSIGKAFFMSYKTHFDR